jgi:hypothetical protein
MTAKVIDRPARTPAAAGTAAVPQFVSMRIIAASTTPMPPGSGELLDAHGPAISRPPTVDPVAQHDR